MLHNNSLEHFIDNNNVPSKSQCGFRSSMSISHALIDLVEEISAIDKKKHTVGIYLH